MRVRLKNHRLAEVLGRSRLSQNHWALRMGLGRGHLSNLVNGRHPYPQAGTRRKLLKGTGLKFEELFEIETGAQPLRAPSIRTFKPSRQSHPPMGPGRRREVLMEILAQDLRYAWRTLLRSPGFTLTVIIVLAIGIGANTAIFSLVENALLRPLPFPQADRIVTLWQDNRSEGDPKEDLSPANFRDWRERTKTLEAVSMIEPYSLDYFGDGRPEVFYTGLVSQGFFHVFPIRPHLGRLFHEEEYQAGSSDVVLLSHRLWTQRFGADPTLVGRNLNLDGRPLKVIGVLPADFRPRFFALERLIWVPRPDQASDMRLRRATYVSAVARLRDGVDLGQAQAEMDEVTRRLAEEYPRANASVGARLIPLYEERQGLAKPILLILQAAVIFVLLIAAANVANLLLLKNAGRRHNFALRSTLGAGRLRLVRQLLTESTLLAAGGALLGVFLAYWGIRLLVALSPADLPQFEGAGINGTVLLFSLGLTVLTALAFGLGPALRFSRPDLAQHVKDGGGGALRSTRRSRGALVVAEVALAVVLLVGAGLALRSLGALLAVDPGFDVDRVLALQTFMPDNYNTVTARLNFYRQALREIGSLPQVEKAGIMTSLPLSEGRLVPHYIDPGILVEGSPPANPNDPPTANMTIATTDAFAAIGIALKKGRLFRDSDDLQSPMVTVINEAMARRFFPDEDPIGRNITVRYGRPFSARIVGVVGDVRHFGMEKPSRPEFYVHLFQRPFYAAIFVVRTLGDSAQNMEAVKEMVWKVNPAQAFYSSATIAELYSESLARWRFNLLLLGCFAAAAFLLALLGIYGVISYSTRQRTGEIGLRMAIGAHERDIRSMVLKEGLGLALIGTALGLLSSLGLMRLMRQQLFGVSTHDPLTLSLIALLLTFAAAAASYIPARRAAAVDPIQALRTE